MMLTIQILRTAHALSTLGLIGLNSMKYSASEMGLFYANSKRGTIRLN